MLTVIAAVIYGCTLVTCWNNLNSNVLIDIFDHQIYCVESAVQQI